MDSTVAQIGSDPELLWPNPGSEPKRRAKPRRQAQRASTWLLLLEFSW